ncbi:hypothetical protein C7U60_12820 [Mesorhizobium plurifarium]|uniref:hypothetical protein n=1 Tax=Sinorhizobium arboris TaxID=76745 RepID=UPI0004096FF0|nr:hypothetical protein [Sinorhizobium arboris]PST22511.1 hypothetical protein C7U60_12820 [Mesorhizobium plurifarium]
MRSETKKSLSPLIFAVVAGGLALVFLLAFRGWITNGADIFLSLAQSGLAWCI